MRTPGSSVSKSEYPIRRVRLGERGMTIERRGDGSIIARNKHPLRPYPAKMTDRLIYWAQAAPLRTFLAERQEGRTWRIVTYGAFYECIRRIGEALLRRGLSPERPLMILSGNGFEHALLLHAAMHVGIPCVPVSPSYSLLVKDFSRLRAIVECVSPGLIFASSLETFGRAVEALPAGGAELVTTGDLAGFAATRFECLEAERDTGMADSAGALVTGDTIAKILFTSGSTGIPKGVINTQRMLCSNQQMIVSMLPCFEDVPPVTVDWLPWHHTFGGNHNLGLILYNGGTLYIDKGRPMPGAFAETLDNLREVAPTVYFNVPRGYEELVSVLERDDALCSHFFSRIRLIFYAAASLSQAVRNKLESLAVKMHGERIVMVSAFGSTETAPSALCPVRHCEKAGFIGIPNPGVELKLVPVASKLEARVCGPNVTPGYWKNTESTAAAFDEEGFYCMGDAVKFLDPEHEEEGFVFDGRLAEDFKLSSGTWVSVGALRAELVSHYTPLVSDAAITGHDRSEVGALIFPNYDACRVQAGLPPEASCEDVILDPATRKMFRLKLESLAKQSTGSSHRITRLLLMSSPPSLEAGEITDKGSLNQGVTLSARAKLVDQLYSSGETAQVIALARSAWSQARGDFAN